MAKKRGKRSTGHESFFEKLTIAVVTAAAAAGTTEAVKTMNEKPAPPPTVVIVEREPVVSAIASGNTDATYASRPPSGAPPTQKGALLFADESGASVDTKPFEVPSTLFTDFFLTSVESGTEPSNAVRLDLKKDDQTSFSFLVDRTNLANAIEKFISDGAKGSLGTATRLTLDLKSNLEPQK